MCAHWCLHLQCLYVRTVAVPIFVTLHDAHVSIVSTLRGGHRNRSSFTPGGLSLSKVYISAFK
ncbi:unnamed protein product [Ixodes pacificus]